MKMGTPPKVSVVITLYNKALYIERAIGSVLAQSYQDYELVVIDDGSTDGGTDLVKKISDPRLRVTQQENGGESAARNRGIQESHGPLIAMLDADDQWFPGFLQAIVSLSERFPEAGIYATGYQTIHRRNLRVETSIVTENGDRQCLILDYFKKACVADFVWSSAQAIPRPVYEYVGGFAENEPMGADLDMWGRIAMQYPIAYDSRPLALYHNEAAGRMVTTWRRRPTFPPFVRSGRFALESGRLNPDLLGDFREYLNRLMLQYIQRVIAAGDRPELRKILFHELYPTKIYRGEVIFLKVAQKILPLRFLYALQRLKNSRWISFRRGVRKAQGVVCRIV